MISVAEIENQIMELKPSLIVQLDLSEEQKKDLVKYAKQQIPHINKSSVVNSDIRLTIALCLLARQIYDQGDFWGNLSASLGVDISQSKSVAIGQIILKTLKKYKLFQIQNNKKRNDYVQNILAQGFYPFKYAKNFYEFLYSFYDRNLGRVLPESIDEDIQDLRNHMYNLMHTQTEDLYFADSKNHAAVSYKLIKSTQYAIAECDSQVITDWILKTLVLIDNYFYNNSTEGMKVGGSLYEWCKNKFENFKTRKISEFKYIQHFRNLTPFLGYDAEWNLFSLCIPERKFPNDTKEVEVEIYKDGTSFYKDNLSLFQAFGCIKSEEMIVNLGREQEVFSEYKIYIDGKLLSTINSSTYRILRSLKRIMSNSLSDDDLAFHYFEVDDFYEGEVCLVVKSGVRVELDNSIFLYNREFKNSFTTYLFNMHDDTTVLIDDIPFDLNSEKVREPYKFFFNTPSNFCMETDDGEDINSAYSHPKIYFNNIDDLLSKNAFIWCNNLKFNLKKEIIYKEISSEEQYAMLDLQKLVKDDIGEYVIRLDIPGQSQKKILSKYLLIKDLEFQTDSDLYIFKNKAIITKKTEHYVRALNVQKLKGYPNKYEYLIPDDTTPKDSETKSDKNEKCNLAKFEIELDEKVYIIKILLKFLKYSFNNKDWYSRSKGRVWDYELSNYLYVDIPDVDKASLMLGKDTYYPIHSVYEQRKLKFDITSIKKRLREEAFNDTLNIEFSILNKVKRYEICRVLNQIDIEKFELGYDEEIKKVYIDTEFYSGKYQFGVEILDLESDELYNYDLDNGRNYLEELLPEGIYNITQYYEEKPLFFCVGEPDRKVVNVLEKQSPTKVLFLPSNCTIFLDELYCDNERFFLGYNYKITKGRAFTNYYWGVLHLNKVNTVPVIFDFVNNNSNQIFMKLSTSIEFCYDKITKTLVSSIAPGLQKDYDRYLFLDSDNSYFNVTIKERRKDY